MANSLGSTITKFTTRLDKVIEQATLTSDLNINGDLVGEVSRTGEVKIAKIALQGLADYDRAKGFTSGDVTLDWETKKLEYDRGREFSIDYLDDEEHMLLVSANIMNEFARTKVVPEIDAIRFARLAANAGETASASFTKAADALSAVLKAEEHMENQGVSLSECILYLTPAVKSLLRQAQSWRIDNGTGSVSTDIQTFDGMKMRTVPQGRFYDSITLQTEGDGGYKKTDSTGKDLNFLVVHPSAAQAIQKHEKLRHFAPDTNQEKDAHKWQYRVHHDLIVYDNRKPLIYAHTAAGA